MLLTIGMIVKNEESRLEKCLSAVKPILDNIDCELIITDTGSTDRTVEIAKKYTDNVLHFDWCDDFSAARNTAFETAKGEWFMFVDADDIFTDCGEIIRFFNSDESKNFGSASFTYRNIRSLDKSDYIDQYVIRIVRKLPQTKFVGRIHEVLDPMPEPIKALGTVVEHYGYFYDNNNDPGAKAKRNERILLKELESTPINDAKSVLLYYYLYQEIRDIDTKKSEQYLDAGEETALKLRSNAIIPIVHEKMRLRLARQEYDAAIIYCGKYFSLDPEIRSGEICADTEVYAVKALALSALGRYEEAIQAFDEFFRLFDLVKSEKLATGDRYIYLPALSGDSNLSDMTVRYVKCCDNVGRTDIIENFLNTYPILEYSDQNGKIGLFPIFDPLMKNDLDISPVLFGIHDVTVISASLCCDHIDGFYNTASKYDPAKIKEQEKLPEAALFYEICVNKALKNSVNANDLIQRFIEIGNLYAGEEGNSSIKLSRIMNEADSYRKNGAYRECIAVLKNALSDNPDSAIPIKGYIDIVSKELNSSPKTSGSSEMEKLAVTVKTNIRKLIGAGDPAAAGKLLDDYSKINPGDPEINELKQLL